MQGKGDDAVGLKVRDLILLLNTNLWGGVLLPAVNLVRQMVPAYLHRSSIAHVGFLTLTSITTATSWRLQGLLFFD